MAPARAAAAPQLWPTPQLLLALLLDQCGITAGQSGERGGYGSFCGIEERGCFQDCYDFDAQKFVTPPTLKTRRILPFGVDGCCSTQQDPLGSCTAGACAKTTCVNTATPGVNALCPLASATCQPCSPAQMDLDVCAAHCSDLGYAFSGVEYANQV